MISKVIIPILLVMLTLAIFSTRSKADELIVNGEFDSITNDGLDGWTISASHPSYVPLTVYATTLYDNISDVVIDPAFTSSPSAAFIGNSVDHPLPPIHYIRSTLSQSIIMPDALGATLTFSYQWRNSALFPPHPDYARIAIGSETLVFKTGADTSDVDWNSVTYYFPLNHQTGVIQSNGQSLELKFETNDDFSPDPNFLLVDDVSLIVNFIATITPTSTYTPTDTPTDTPTISPTVTDTPTITPTVTITPTITKSATLTPWFIQEGTIVAYPNPANGNEVKFIYTTQQIMDSAVIEVYNLAGLKVATLTDGQKPAGINQQTTWAIDNVAPGIYLYRRSRYCVQIQNPNYRARLIQLGSNVSYSSH